MFKNLYLVSLMAAIALVCTSCSWWSKQVEQPSSSMLVINILDDAFYHDAHIKGSISVPMMDLMDYVATLDKEMPIVVYCSNYACGASGMAALQLKKAGFEQVRAYEGGMAEWYQLNEQEPGAYPVDGPATKSYLKEPNPKQDIEDTTIPAISAQELKKMMSEHSLL